MIQRGYLNLQRDPKTLLQLAVAPDRWFQCIPETTYAHLDYNSSVVLLTSVLDLMSFSTCERLHVTACCVHASAETVAEALYTRPILTYAAYPCCRP